MLRIAWDESHYREMAKHTNPNGSIDIGYLQINSVHGYSKECLYNLACNIAAGYEIYTERISWGLSGYGAWAVY